MYTDKDNEYISTLYDLVEAVYYKDYTSDNKNARNITKYRNNAINKAYEKCTEVIGRIRNLANSLSFKDMWDFADFIMVMEKVYFYQNIQKSGVCCDKCTLDERILFFDYSERNVYIKIIMHRSTTADNLDIIVYREYGKKVLSKISVGADGKSNIASDDDQMLANTINAYIQNSIADLYESYVILAKTRSIYDTVLGYVEGNKNEKDSNRH